MVSGWHHHGDYDTSIYVVRGSVRMESGPGGSQVVDAGPGDFLYVPKGAIHREGNPGSEESHLVVVRAGRGPTVVNVDGPARSHQPFATVASFAQDGSVLSDTIVPLNRRGIGSKSIVWGDAARIDVTLTNAGHAYRCNRNTQYSCAGNPLDENQRFGYKVTAVKP